MKENKKMIGIAVIALLVSLTSIGIAFAAMSQDLTIGASGGTFDPATWAVRFNVSSLSKQTTGGATGTLPSINATTIGTYSVTLTKPGDSVTYTFIVENDGTLDAVIDTLTKPSQTCVGSAAGAQGTTDAALVCNNLKYTLTNDTKTGTAVATGQTLAKKNGTATQKTMVLHIEYPSTMTQLPSDDVTITLPQVVISYVQA